MFHTPGECILTTCVFAARVTETTFDDEPSIEYFLSLFSCPLFQSQRISHIYFVNILLKCGYARGHCLVLCSLSSRAQKKSL